MGDVPHVEIFGLLAAEMKYVGEAAEGEFGDAGGGEGAEDAENDELDEAEIVVGNFCGGVDPVVGVLEPDPICERKVHVCEVAGLDLDFGVAAGYCEVWDRDGRDGS